MIELSPLLGCLPNECGKLKLEETVEMLVKELCLFGFAGFTAKWANIIKEKVLENNSKLHELRLDQTVYAAELYSSDKPDVISFIKYIENYKIPVKTNDKCVQIITVYKAKGLEYDMVILPKLSIRNGILNARIHEGIQIIKDENTNQEFALLFPPRDIALADERIKEKIKNLDTKYCYEQLCVLYVALTRAKKAMYIFSEPDSEKSKTIYLSTIINRLLGNKISINQSITGLPLIYEHGNSEWFISS
jgi:ATP-dependent helicase/nuclease subunit A